MTSKKVKRFLIVDDADSNLLFFEMLLKNLGFVDIQTAHTGPEGMEIVEANKADFVIVAWELSTMPGTVFVQKTRSVRKRRHLPCVIFSKRMSEEDVRLLKEIGIDNVLAMPFDKEKASAFITSMIAAWERPDPVIKAVRDIDDLIETRAYNDALRLVSPKILAPGPHAHLAHTAHGEIWMRLSRHDKAEAALNEALRIKPDHVGALRLMAKIKSLKGLHQEALVILEQLAKASPSNITTMLHLGSAYVKADRHEDAKKILDTVSALDPDYKPVNDELGTIAFKEGDLSLAAKLLSETESGDDIAAYFNNLGIAYVARNEIDKGVETYNNAMSVLATKAKLYVLQYNLGLALRKKGDLAAALKQLAESYCQEPTFEKAYAAYVKLYKELKEAQKEPDALKATAPKVKEARAKFTAAGGTAAKPEGSAA